MMSWFYLKIFVVNSTSAVTCFGRLFICVEESAEFAIKPGSGHHKFHTCWRILNHIKMAGVLLGFAFQEEKTHDLSKG